MATLVNEDEERPQISGYNQEQYYSRFEAQKENEILKQHKQRKPRTIMDMKLNEIVDNTVNVIANFGDDYQKQMYKVQESMKLDGYPSNFFRNLWYYLLALMKYIGEKDNILYLGILLCFVSIIIYFFNITTQNDSVPRA
jgi:hypothetical protein